MENLLKTGSLLRERYKIKKVLYEGRFYNIYLAEDPETKGTIQITEFHLAKLPPAKRSLTEEQFLEAIDLRKALSHPMLPTVLDGFYHEDHAYLVMTYGGGLSLEQYLTMAVNPFTVPEAIERGLKIIDALAYLYDRPSPLPFSHLDAPHILIDEQANMSLMGFGLHIFLDHYFSSTDPYAFCAPEISEGKAFSIQSAVYALGALLYYMTTKQKFDIRSKANARPREVIKDMPAGFDEVLEKALAKEPASRFIDMETFSRKLREVINPPPPPPEQVPEVTPKEGTLQKETSRFVKWFVRGAIIACAVLAVLAAPFLIKSFIKGQKPPGADMAYVLPEEKNQILIFDLKTGKEQAWVTFLGTAKAIGIAENGERLFIARKEKSILVADAKSGSSLGSFPLEDEPSNLIVAPQGPFLYITGTNSPDITAWDSDTLKTDCLITSGVTCRALAASPDGSAIFAAGIESREIAVIDSVKKSITASFSLEESADEIVATRDGTFLLVLSSGKTAFYQIGAKSLAKELMLGKGQKHGAAARGKEGPDYAYVACESDGAIFVLDCASFSVVKKTVTRGVPRALAVYEGGKVLYVATVAPESLLLFDSATLRLIKEYPLPFKPSSLLVH
ncbi:MAG: protein kinase [Candidatus Eremiobacteraeota bacterium]|nr:protein kinase [Candidatus Eremiobacteraeota bacterium]